MDTHIKAEKSGDVTIIHFLMAELSLVDADDLKKVLYTYVSDTANKFVVDFHQCPFMSSAALGVLVCFTARVHSYDGRVVLCSPTKEVATVLDITKLGMIYDIYPTQEEAVRSFQAAPKP